jgi:dTDP-4-amino-4,6-dideoxygalactose transaminase
MFEYELLEKEFSEYIGVKDTVCVNSGTAALHLAFAGKHYPKGSEVIVPEFTMIATAWGPQYEGLQVVPIDCLDNMNIDPSLIEESLTDKTVAILITHVYGRVCEMAPILELCERYGLDLFEDCAEVHGALYKDGPDKGHRVGSLGIGCFSFYRNKIVSGEEGGAITVRNNPTYADHLRDLKNMSFGSGHDYIHEFVGFNYRMSDAQAALVRSSLREVDKVIAHRKATESWYNKYLDTKVIRSERDVVWVYDVNYEDSAGLVSFLNEQGVAARRCFYPMSHQPSVFCEETLNLKAMWMYNRTCYLPVTDSISEQEVKEICKLINTFTYKNATFSTRIP